jgi:hypothetical protein
VNDTQRVAEELAELLGEVDTSGYAGTGEFAHVIALLEELRWVNPHLPIGWPVMPSGLVHKAGAYLKKGVRIALRWYVNPIVEQQNRYNEAVARSLRLMYAETVRLKTLALDLEAQLQDASASVGAAQHDAR